LTFYAVLSRVPWRLTIDLFHFGSFFNDPTDFDTTTPFLFFIRFITRYYTPTFIFLAGTSAFLYGKKNGSYSDRYSPVVLIFLEIITNNLIKTFDFTISL
tara:strand:- start:34449 stop:34748 length:300 start_codon:yes stop_codon:yes gene_type:complete